MLRRIRRVTAADLPWLVLEVSGTVAAYAYVIRYPERPAYRWSVESSICVREDVRGRGAGRRLYDALLRLLERQGMRSVYAASALPNLATCASREPEHRAAGRLVGEGVPPLDPTARLGSDAPALRHKRACPGRHPISSTGIQLGGMVWVA
jgi:GNAT superfamily N-acetyltransferase